MTHKWPNQMLQVEKKNLFIEQGFKNLFQKRKFMERVFWHFNQIRIFIYSFAGNKNESFCEAIQLV